MKRLFAFLFWEEAFRQGGWTYYRNDANGNRRAIQSKDDATIDGLALTWLKACPHPTVFAYSGVAKAQAAALVEALKS